MTDQPGITVTRLDDGRLQLVALREKRPLTFNATSASPFRKGSHKLQNEIAGWRRWAGGDDVKLCLLAGQLEPLNGEVHVDAYHWRINRAAMPDTGAPMVAVKAVIDGLVDAGLLPGDDPKVVRSLTFHAPIVIGRDALRVVVTTLPGTEQTALTLPTTEGPPTP